MSRALPWYKWCPRDFTAETRGWPLIAKGVYRELLDAAWDMTDGLPPEPADLRRLAGASSKEWTQAWRYCEPRFPVGDDGLRHSPYIDAMRRQATEVSRQRSFVGQLGALKRWSGPQRVGRPNGNSHPVATGADGNSHTGGMPSTSTSHIKESPDSGRRPSRKRARPASPEGPRARPGAAIDETSEEIQRKRAEAAALAEATR